MKIKIKKYFSKKYSLAWTILFIGLLIVYFVLYQYNSILLETHIKELEYKTDDFKNRINSRFYAHAAILRSGAAFIEASDTVTREEWKQFIRKEKLDVNLPGIQGVGYSIIIPKNQLKKHIENTRKAGFPDYKVFPEFDREIYTSIYYIEPFSGRNLRAFGYDMLSDSVRREAMIRARDYDVAALSRKVTLIQETKEDIQSGTLMYVPVYSKLLKDSSIENRRKYIKGWVYSPYRMRDLIKGVFRESSIFDNELIRIEIFDGLDTGKHGLLFDNFDEDIILSSFNILTNTSIIDFNGKEWTVKFYYFYEKKEENFLRNIILLAGGFFTVFLAFIYMISFINSKELNNTLITNNKKLDESIAIQKNLIQELAQNELELRKVADFKNKLFSLIAHDLKNPFNSIIGFLQLVKMQLEENDYEGMKEFIDIIFKSSLNLNLMLDNLLEWSLNQTDRIKINKESVNVFEIADNIRNVLNLNLKQKDIAFINNVPKDANILFDKSSLNAIIRNLVSNAIKFTNKGGKITVHFVENDTESIITIEDNGVGIKQENLNKLQSSDSTFKSVGTNDEKGTGLGLLICKELIEKNNSKFSIESSVGIGTKVSIIIPK